MFILRYICTVKELLAGCRSDTIRAASVFAGGAITAFLVRSCGGGEVIVAAAVLGLLARAASLAVVLRRRLSVRTAAKLVRVAGATAEVGALGWRVPVGKCVNSMFCY